jgi:hypothetical protein
MRYLFLLLALLGLARSGDFRGHAVPSGPAAHRGLSQAAPVSSIDTATISEVGTPEPRRK